MSVADTLGAWAASLRWSDVPEPMQRQARAIWLETFGCVLHGGAHAETVALATMLRNKTPEGRTASAVGPSPRLAPLDAILVNGLASGVDLLDGGNIASRGHVGGYVMAAVLTAAEAADASFAEALTAFVVGYEVAARIGAACRLHPTLHPASTWSVIGAAAAVEVLRGRDAKAIAQTLDLAANMTLATSWDTAVHGASARDLYHPLSNYLGTLAADFSSVGFTGAPHAIETTFGTISAPAFDADRCLDGLGTDWLMSFNYMKRYPNCRHFHGVLDVALQVLAELPSPFDPARDRVRTGADPLAIANNTSVHTQSRIAAAESLPVSLAMTLVLGKTTPAMYAEGAYEDPRVLALAHRIEIEEAPRPFEAARPGWIEIEQPGRSPVRRAIDVPYGDPGNPLALAELREKFVEISASALGPRAGAIADAMLDGDVEVSFRAALPDWLGLGVAVE